MEEPPFDSTNINLAPRALLKMKLASASRALPSPSPPFIRSGSDNIDPHPPFSLCSQDVRQHEAVRALPGGDPGLGAGDARARARVPRALLLVRGVRGALDEGRPLRDAGGRRAVPAALRDGRRAASGPEPAGPGLPARPALPRPALPLARVPPPSSPSSSSPPRAAAPASLDAPPAPARQPGVAAALDAHGARRVLASQGALL